jgi:ATP synthase protein I
MPDFDQQETNRKSGLAYAAALTLFAAVVVFCGLGWMADRYFGTSPWLLAAGLVVGSIVGLFEFIRLASRTR